MSVIYSLLVNQIKCGTNKIKNTSSMIIYLKSNFFSFLEKIINMKNKLIDNSKYTNKYLDKKPKAANKPIKTQSLKVIILSL